MKFKKKIIAGLTAIVFYKITEKNFYTITNNKKNEIKKLEQGNLWGISGRQNIMQMRNIMNLKIFKS